MPPQNRIKHVVVLMLENRSFDHIFGFAQPAHGQVIENLVGGGFSNLLDPSKPESATNPRFPASQPAPFAVHDKDGPSHSFNGTSVQLCNDSSGPSAAHPVRNNGFVRNYKDHLLHNTNSVEHEALAEVMASFAPNQLPTINALAQNFCLCDHWFCEVPGPTMPNRMYVHAATSEGYVHNAFGREFTSKQSMSCSRMLVSTGVLIFTTSMRSCSSPPWTKRLLISDGSTNDGPRMWRTAIFPPTLSYSHALKTNRARPRTTNTRLTMYGLVNT
jgi:Phospholipase C